MSLIGLAPLYAGRAAGFAAGGRESYGRAVQDSSAWQRTSMPLAAVTDGGSETVVSGSMIASRGIRARLAIAVLTCSPSTLITHVAVASAPVPAVVGSAINGFNGRDGASPRPIGGLR